MPLPHILLAILVAFIYGTAFVAIKLSVSELPPLLVTGYRYLFAALPLVFFVRRPEIAIRWLAAYGVMQGVVMFGLIFSAIRLGMPPGLASLVVQLQVFFTVIFAFMIYGERPTAAQTTGATLGFCGVAVIGASNSTVSPVLPFLMVIASGAAWGMANIIAKAAKPTAMLGFIVWSSLFAPVPLFLLSMAFESTRFGLPDDMPSATAIASIAYLAYPTTVFAFAAWVFLLRRYPAASVTPYALLVPVFGMTSTAIVFAERFPLLTAIGSLLVFIGLAVHMFGARLATWARK